MMPEKDRIEAAIRHIQSAVDVDPWAKVLCEQIMRRAIPAKPTGWDPNKPYNTGCRCGVCGTRVRSGQGSSSRTKDTVCRNCFTVIDWGNDK